ncbi:MAG: PorP/SprF family type IX secretion system membrane protein [Bacteroidota bacterium]
MRLFKVILSLLIASFTFGQDIHFSQFFHAPLLQNPANTGAFDGDFRGVFNQRTQWRSITDPYNTWDLTVDARNIGNFNNLHGGLVFFKDAAGTSPLNTLSIMPTGAYDFYQNTDSTGKLSAGIQLGFTQKTINFDALVFDNQYNGSVFDPNLGNGESFANDRSAYFDAHFGLNWTHRYSEEINYNAGFAIFHVTSPTETFFNDDVNLDRRFLIHAQGEYRIDPQWSAIPAFQWQSQGKYRELLFGGMAKRILQDRFGIYRAVYFGAFGRSKDAAYLVAAMDYDNWKAGISYDINLSDLRPVSRSRGGFEMSVIYIFKGFKEIYEQHRICPNFI